MSLERATLRLYHALARAFPYEFRQEFGTGLTGTADDVVREAARRGGWIGLLLLTPRLLGDLAVRLVVEHWRDAVRDARYAARMLAHAPGFTLAAVVCLAIGIGLTAAMYSQIQSTVFRAIPGVREAGALVRLQRPTSFVYFEHLRDVDSPFASLAAYMGPVPVVVSRDGAEPQRVWGHIATPAYFDVLGVRAALGRTFGAEEETPGAARAVVLSHRFWETRFGRDVSVVGQSIRINGQSATVLGVAPAGFLGASPTTSAADVWIPTTAPEAAAPELASLRAPLAHAFDVIGRLKSGIINDQAEGALEPRLRRLEQVYGDPLKDSQERRIRLLPGGRMLPIRNEDLPRAIGFPLVLVSLVLLMACGNVANMLLARNDARRREIAVRLSLGAGPGRILRQLLTESVMLTALGAAAGAAFAFWLLSVFASMRDAMPAYGHFEVRFEWPAFALVAILAAGFAVMFGLAPALRAGRADIYTGLKPNSSSATRRRWFSMRNTLVFQQVTVSVMLVLLTGFIVVGWQRSAGVDVGFDPSRLYVARLDPVRDGYTPEQSRQFFDELPARLRRVPGITAASLAQTLPLAMSSGDAMLTARTEFAAGTSSLGAIRADRVGEGFFETVGTPLRRGRGFTHRDESDESRVVVVSDTTARQVWPGEDPVGRTIDLEGDRLEVIGVVGDIRSAFPLAPTLPAVYRPVTPSGFAAPSRHGVSLAIRVVPGFDASTRLRREIDAIDPRLTVFQVTRMDDDLAQAQFLARFGTMVYGGMGVFGLVLASVGLAGVTAQAVARRRREIGIRMALGAKRADVLWLVLRESGAIVAAGSVAGLAAALLITRALASVVETLAETTRTSMTDPLLLVGGPALLAGLALAACYVPARHSTRIDPATVLRAE